MSGCLYDREGGNFEGKDEEEDMEGRRRVVVTALEGRCCLLGLFKETSGRLCTYIVDRPLRRYGSRIYRIKRGDREGEGECKIKQHDGYAGTWRCVQQGPERPGFTAFPYL